MTRINPTPMPSPQPDPLGSLAHLLGKPPKQGDASQAVPLDRLEVPRLPGMARAERRHGMRPTRERPGATRRKQAPAPKARTGQELSREERAERQRVATPKDGLGFAFGKAEVTPGRLQTWLGSLSNDQRKSLAHPRTVITVTVSTSSVGSPKSNRQLAQARGEAMTKALRSLGFKGAVTVKHDIAPDRRRDNANERVARLSIYSGEQRFHDFIRKTGQKARAAASARSARRQKPQVMSMAKAPAPVRQAFNQRMVTRGTTDKPLRIQGHLILSRPGSGAPGVVKTDSVPEGYSRLHGNFVHRRGEQIQTQPRFPEEPEEVRAMARRAGRQLDDSTVRKLTRAGTELNRLYDKSLKAGRSITESARHVRLGAARLLHAQVLKMFKLSN